MKKSAFIFGMALAVAGLTACDDMLPNPEPATFPELELFNSDDLAIAQSGNPEAVINLDTYAQDGTPVELAKVTELVNFPATFDLVFEFEASLTPDFAKTATFTASRDGDVIYVPASTLNTVIYDNFTHDPAQTKLYTRVAAYAVQGTSTMRLGGADKIYGEYTYTVLPFAPAIVLYNDYYLMYRPAGTDSWQTLRFNKVDVGSSPYDNGQFAIKVEAPAGGLEWAVAVAKPTDAEQYLSPVTDEAMPDAMEGTLVYGTSPVPATIAAEQTAPYLVSIDVLTETYTVTSAIEKLYVPGAATSTSNFNSVLALFTDDYVKYEGTMRLYNTYYFTAQPSNDGLVYLLAKDEEGKDAEITTSETGVVTAPLGIYGSAGSATSFNASNGLYYIVVNTGTLRMTVTPINSIQVIGAFNGWNLETAPELTQSSRFRTWTVKDVELTEGEEFKFCVDHDWAISYGGAFDDLRQNGGNLKAPATGKYDIVIDFAAQPNTVTMTRK